MILHYLKRSFFTSLVILFISCSGGKAVVEDATKILPPADLYGELFYDVQKSNIFEDSKTFVDAIPIWNVDSITHRYSKRRNLVDGELRNFVFDNFELPQTKEKYRSDSLSIKQHITSLWKVLERPLDIKHSGTLIPLPNPYIVPGGRFREIYYWDSYFTMLGLKEDGQIETIQNMVDNFSYLIDTYGFIPNGNRTYYLGRSQPSFYAMMIKVLAEIKGEETYVKYLPYLEKEYNFWMDGEATLNSLNPTKRRVVLLEDGEVLNRYWDDNNSPRPESYKEDVRTAGKALQDFPELSREDIYRNLRAGAESGWDFSSRWLVKNIEGNYDLSTIRTTHIIPIDLNVLLFNMERTLSKAFSLKGNLAKANVYKAKYLARKKTINKYLWNEKEGFFKDYNFVSGEQTETISLAGVYPLFFDLANDKQARSVSEKIEKVFLRPGGLVTTINNTGQQWDAPNGWAPLQYISIQGLRNYGFNDLASKISQRWLSLNQKVYQQSFKMLEKYNVEDLSKESGGGEYPTQDGFGWTNGVFQKLSQD